MTVRLHIESSWILNWISLLVPWFVAQFAVPFRLNVVDSHIMHCMAFDTGISWNSRCERQKNQRHMGCQSPPTNERCSRIFQDVCFPSANHVLPKNCWPCWTTCWKTCFNHLVWCSANDMVGKRFIERSVNLFCSNNFLPTHHLPPMFPPMFPNHLAHRSTRNQRSKASRLRTFITSRALATPRATMIFLLGWNLGIVEDACEDPGGFFGLFQIASGTHGNWRSRNYPLVI